MFLLKLFYRIKNLFVKKGPSFSVKRDVTESIKKFYPSKLVFLNIVKNEADLKEALNETSR